MRAAVCVCALLLALAGTASPASARSCEQIAAACLKVAIKGGYNESEWRRICFEPKRMAVCKRTGKYHAPSGGRVWQADR